MVKGATGDIASKLDMSLDDVIAASVTPRNRRRGADRSGPFRFQEDNQISFRGRRRGGFGGNEKRNFYNAPPLNARWRGGAFRRARADWGARRQFTAFDAETGENVIDLETDDVPMSDGEIPSLRQAGPPIKIDSRIQKRAALFRQGPRPARSSAAAEGRHVRVAGLDYSILTSDLQSIGPVEKCWIDFDRTDRSLGTGGVIFKSALHAQLAVEKFDGRLIDGIPLQLEIATRQRLLY